VKERLLLFKATDLNVKTKRAQEVWERLDTAGWPSAFIAGGQVRSYNTIILM